MLFTCELACDCDFWGQSRPKCCATITHRRARQSPMGEHLLSEDATTLTFKDAIKCAEAFEHARAERNHSQVISAVQAPVQSCWDKLLRDSLVKNNKKSKSFHDQTATTMQMFSVWIKWTFGKFLVMPCSNFTM